MDEQQIAEFIQHYERITRRNLDKIGEVADVVLELDEYHSVRRKPLPKLM